MSHVNNNCRVIALLDLDCFYCHCESVRLSISNNLPLAVFQWSGAIAVNYAAREKGIKRFMKYEDMKKVAKDIVAIHVEVEGINPPRVNTAESTTESRLNESTLKESTLNYSQIEEDVEESYAESSSDYRKSRYEQQYSMTVEEKKKVRVSVHGRHVRSNCYIILTRLKAFERENGYFPNRADNKANIERYRYVSGLIFKELRTFLDEKVGPNKYKLEKASVDELYVDLTQYVNDNTNTTSPTGKGEERSRHVQQTPMK